MSIDADSDAMVAAMFTLEQWLAKHTSGAVYEEGCELVGALIDALMATEPHRQHMDALRDAVRTALEVRGYTADADDLFGKKGGKP